MCDDGKYISKKACVDCPGHCKDEAPCNKLTGMCDNGCANQWTGTFCNSMLLWWNNSKAKFYFINRLSFISETRLCCSKRYMLSIVLYEFFWLVFFYEKAENMFWFKFWCD